MLYRDIFLSDVKMAFWRIFFQDKKKRTQDGVEVVLYHYFYYPIENSGDKASNIVDQQTVGRIFMSLNVVVVHKRFAVVLKSLKCT